MKAAILAVPDPPGKSASDRLRQLALVRIAAGDGRTTRSVLAQDLAQIVPHRLPVAQWRALIERDVEALLGDGLAGEAHGRLQVSTAGADAARRFLGLRGALPRTWSELSHVRLLAKALGLERLAVKELKALERPDGLRAAIVQTAYKVKVKGIATPSRLRSALAALALQRAFGNQISATLSGKSALPARAGRLLAAQLCRSPRDFGTDTRLIAALAAEHLGTKSADLEGLRRAVFCRFFAGVVEADNEPSRLPAKPEAVPPLRAGTACRRRRSARPFRASCSKFAGTLRHTRTVGSETARPTSLMSGARWRTRAPTGAYPRSSSSACCWRRIAPDSWRSRTPISRITRA